MIFDSESMSKMRDKYASEPDYTIPRVVLLDRSPQLTSEREYLEELVQSAPRQTQKGWVARLISTEPAQHLGAWFEIMLFGWLRKIGSVKIEPWVDGSQPDFLLNVGRQEIVLEARACLIDEAERERDELEAEILARLNKIPLPYVVNIERLIINSEVNTDEMMERVNIWLRTASGLPFHYQDNQGKKYNSLPKNIQRLRP